MKFKIFAIVPIIILLTCGSNQNLPSCEINGDRMINHIETQLSFGPRIPGSESSLVTAEYFSKILKTNGWQIEFQDFLFDYKNLKNVIAKNTSLPPKLIIGTHYDTRLWSDQDPYKSKKYYPVPGAIDGASGSSILLELSQHLLKCEDSIWLVFFDGEDQGHINQWEWSIGAEYFASQLKENPKNVVILDMLGDSDLKVYVEKNSNESLSNEIWAVAHQLGYQKNFVNEQKYALIDDHLPFINRGIPAVLLIDFDYPFWHTSSDTLDKVSKHNLVIAAEVMLEWLKSTSEIKCINLM